MDIRLKIALVTCLGIIICLTLLPATNAGKGEVEKSITLDQLPAAVRATVDRETGKGSVHEIERATVNGVDVYCVDIVRDGKTFDTDIAADGRIINTGIEAQTVACPLQAGKLHGKGCPESAAATKVRLDQLPSAARATVKRQAGNGKIGDIEKAAVNGVEIYCADITKDGKTADLDVAADGKVFAPTTEIKNITCPLKTSGDKSTACALNATATKEQGQCTAANKAACPDDCEYRHSGCAVGCKLSKSPCPDDCEYGHPVSADNRKHSNTDCSDDCGDPHPDCEDDD